MEHDERLVSAARAAHEANRVLCEALGEQHYGSWEEAPEEIRASAISGVRDVRANPSRTPPESHEAWSAFKRGQGWKHGPEKSLERKEHPCLVPYDDLPFAQQAKDTIFIAVVRAVLSMPRRRDDDGVEFEFFEGTPDQLPAGGGWTPVCLAGTARTSKGAWRWRRLAR